MTRTRKRLAAVEAIKRQIISEVRYDLDIEPMSQRAFAKQVGLSQADVSLMLAGKHLERFTVDRLLMVLIALGHKPTISVC